MILAVRTKVRKEKLFQCHIGHHRSHMNRHGIDERLELPLLYVNVRLHFTENTACFHLRDQ